MIKIFTVFAAVLAVAFYFFYDSDQTPPVTATSTIKTKILLHVADPKNVEWWFDNITTKGAVTDFDMIGFSYYPLWHTTVGLEQLSDKIAGFRSKYNRPVLILETAYPWTTGSNDSYNNHFGSQSAIAGYPYTKKGQSDIMIKMTQEVLDGGGQGIIYWEPAWITSRLNDGWGVGSSWDNVTLFDFNGNVLKGADYMCYPYKFK